MKTIDFRDFQWANHGIRGTKNPFFTILTASLNSEKTLVSLLESLRIQSFREFEHIVIDGGSQDNTLKILADYPGTFRRRWMSTPDRGIAHALNKGLQLAKGQYILIIHGDDRLLDENVLSRVYNELKNENVDICSYSVQKETPNEALMPYRPIRLCWWYHFKTILPHQGCFVHRRVFERIRVNSEKISRLPLIMIFFIGLSPMTPRYILEFYLLRSWAELASAADPAMLQRRLNEEALVQRMNEKKFFWRMSQRLFHLLYFPYKTQFST